MCFSYFPLFTVHLRNLYKPKVAAAKSPARPKARRHHRQDHCHPCVQRHIAGPISSSPSPSLHSIAHYQQNPRKHTFPGSAHWQLHHAATELSGNRQRRILPMLPTDAYQPHHPSGTHLNLKHPPLFNCRSSSDTIRSPFRRLRETLETRRRSVIPFLLLRRYHRPCSVLLAHSSPPRASIKRAGCKASAIL